MEYPNPIEPTTLQRKVIKGVTDHPVKVTPLLYLHISPLLAVCHNAD